MPTARRTAAAALAAAATLGAAVAAGGWWWAHRQARVPAGPVAVTVQPATVWLEPAGEQLVLNADFVIENQGPSPLGIDRIELLAADADGQPIARRFVDGNGFAPAMQALAPQPIPPGGRQRVFNPFTHFPAAAPPATLTVTFSLSIPNEAPDAAATVVLRPQRFQPQTVLQLPLAGPLLVHDGHDFLAHHRRLDVLHPVAAGLGLTHNFMRHAIDLNPVEGAAALPYRGDGTRNADWLAWGAPVRAPAAGTVVDADSATPDNERGGANHFRADRVKAEPMHFYGNHVVIDHGNGEFSLLGHLQQGSVAVKPGDRVVAGQVLARAGSSGSSNNPHLHYELRTGRGLQADGLPAVFTGFTRRLGAQRLPVATGTVDSGDLVESP